MELCETDQPLVEEYIVQKRTSIAMVSTLLALFLSAGYCHAGKITLDAAAIAKAADRQTTINKGVVRIGWSRDDVAVEVDGMPLPAAAGLGSWAAFKATGKGQDAIVMGDTVVFQDEVDSAMDAALAHGLSITALHNHFFYDQPKVYFMHIGGQGPAPKLAAAVKAVWDAVKALRASQPVPGKGFSGAPRSVAGTIATQPIKTITGLEPAIKPGGVVKISTGRHGLMSGTVIGGGMGLSSWAAFTGSDSAAVMDGDFIMAAADVQPVLMALRKAGIHIVALHNHMTGEQPPYYFVHFWGKGPVVDLAKGFKAALQAQGHG